MINLLKGLFKKPNLSPQSALGIHYDEKRLCYVSNKATTTDAPYNARHSVKL